MSFYIKLIAIFVISGCVSIDVADVPKNINNLVKEPQDYYFVHSYYFECKNDENILAETCYGINFTSIVGKENIYGVQFHPEKSSSQGLNLLKEFIRV